MPTKKVAKRPAKDPAGSKSVQKDSPLWSIYQSWIKNGFAVKAIKKDRSEHLLVLGDCERATKLIPDGSVDLILTDPPYNKGLYYGSGFNDRKSRDNYLKWLQNKLMDIPRVLKPTGSFYLISYPEINVQLFPFLENVLKLKFRRWITWHYPTNIGHSKRNYTRSQRSILFFTKTDDYIFNREHLIQHYKNPTAPVIRKRLANGSKGRTSYDLLRFLDLMELQKGLIDILDINLLKNNSSDRIRNLKERFRALSQDELRKKDHPCQLPLALLEIFIKVSTNQNNLVFDPFAGTFTTSLAAGKLGRHSMGIEVNNKFLNFGATRLKI